MRGKREAKIYMPANYEKSNKLITGKSNMTLSEQKTIAYALRKLRDVQVARPNHRFTDEEMRMGIKVEMSPREFVREVFKGKNATSIGKVLSTIAAGLHSSTILLETEEGNPDNWKTYSFIKTCEYKDGVFSITFHEEASVYLVNLQDHGNFTLLDYNVVSELDSSYAVRVYEYIEKEYRRQVARDKSLKTVEFYVDMVEFKTSIGVIDPDNHKVKELLNAYPAPSSVRYDYKERIELMEKLADIDRNMNTTTKLQRRQACKYNKFYELRRNVLEVAKNQINSVDFYNLAFDYEAVCAPGGKRVVGIHFTIYNKKDYHAVKESYEQMELPLENVNRAGSVDGVENVNRNVRAGSVGHVENVDGVESVDCIAGAGSVRNVENVEGMENVNRAGKVNYTGKAKHVEKVNRAESADVAVGEPEVIGIGRSYQSVESLAAILDGIGVTEYLKTYERYPCRIDGMKMNEVSLLKDITRTLIEEIFDLAVKQKTIQNIICAADYQQVRIVDNLLYVKKMYDKGMEIDNLEGYLTAAVKEDYAASEGIEMKSAKRSPRKRAGAFERRQYNMEELESELLKCKG